MPLSGTTARERSLSFAESISPMQVKRPLQLQHFLLSAMCRIFLELYNRQPALLRENADKLILIVKRAETVVSYCYITRSLKQQVSCFLSFEPVLSLHCLAALDLGTGVEQPIDCFIIQNRQAVQYMGRLMDWTLTTWSTVCFSVLHSQSAEGR